MAAHGMWMVHVPARQVRGVSDGGSRRDLLGFASSVPAGCRITENRLTGAAVADSLESPAAQQLAGVVGGADVQLLQ